MRTPLSLSSASSALLPLLLLAAPASAQWSTNPAVNNAIGDQSGEQVTSKIAADGSGGTWIGWFDNASGNYDVYVQHLDPQGNETFAHNGLAVSTHPNQSSLVDWDLMSDAQGNCVVVFSDIRSGPDLDIYAYRIDTAGTFLWGANGVTLSSNSDFEPAPRVAQLSDGNFIFVWTKSPSPGDATIRMQKLDSAGVPQFPADGLPISGAPGEDLGFCNVVAAENGGYIVSWVRDISTFLSPRHIRAREYDTNGSPVWASYTAVYDFNAIPIAHDPILQSDGNGGAWLAWHRSNAGTFDALVQHLDTNGVELYAHNGLAVSNEAARSKFSPSLAQLANGDVIVAFDKRNNAQSTWGVSVQRIDPAGNLVWGANGVEIAPYDTINESFQRAVPYGDGAIVLWFEQPGATPPKRVLAQRVDAAGTPQWIAGGIEVCSNLTSKDDLEIDVDGSGVVRAAWTDERTVNGNDIFAQNVNGDGTLGAPPNIVGFCFSDGTFADHTTPCPCGNTGAPGNGCGHSFDANGANLSASGQTVLDDVVLHSQFEPVSSFTLFMQHANPGDTIFHDGVLCAGNPLIRLRGRGAVGGEAFFPNSLFANDSTLTLSQRGGVFPGQGVTRFYAAWYRNASSTFCPPATANVTNGISIGW